MIDPVTRHGRTPVDASDRTVRQFGVLCGVLLGAAAAREVFGRGAMVRGGRMALLAAAVAVIALVRPRIVRPLFLAAIAITTPIRVVVSRVILGIMYYGIFTPMAVVFRLTGRDALSRRRHTEARTYWVAKVIPTDVRSYFRQS